MGADTGLKVTEGRCRAYAFDVFFDTAEDIVSGKGAIGVLCTLCRDTLPHVGIRLRE
jgi:hypothetical protein